MNTRASSRPPGRALRAVVVVDDLAELRGPRTGQHRLPHRLDASARHTYDFADPQWRELAYRTVLMEAATPADLTRWVHHDALLAAWPELFLPPHIRQAWQLRHPELSRAGAGPRVPPAA